MDSMRALSPSFQQIYGAECNCATSGGVSECTGAANGGEGESTCTVHNGDDQGGQAPITGDGFEAQHHDSMSQALIGLQNLREAGTSDNAPIAPASTPPATSGDDSKLSVGDVAEDCLVTTGLTADTCSSIAERLGFSAAVGAIVGAAGYALAGIGQTVLGGFQIAKGIHQRNPERAVNGAGNLCDGVSNSMQSVAIAASRHPARAALGQVAGKLVAPFALASSAIDVSLGVKDIVTGAKNHSKSTIVSGALGVGFGVAMAASVLGAGLPALIVGGSLWVAKCGLQIKEHIQNRRNSAPPEPPAQNGTQTNNSSGAAQGSPPSSAAPNTAPAGNASPAVDTSHNHTVETGQPTPAEATSVPASSTTSAVAETEPPESAEPVSAPASHASVTVASEQPGPGEDSTTASNTSSGPSSVPQFSGPSAYQPEEWQVYQRQN